MNENSIYCGRCYDEVEAIFPPSCKEKPEALGGCALGQYHCPECGAMLLAGLPHPRVCAKCLTFSHPFIDGMRANHD